MRRRKYEGTSVRVQLSQRLAPQVSRQDDTGVLRGGADLPRVATVIERANQGQFPAPDSCGRIRTDQIQLPLSRVHAAHLQEIPSLFQAESLQVLGAGTRFNCGNSIR